MSEKTTVPMSLQQVRSLSSALQHILFSGFSFILRNKLSFTSFFISPPWHIRTQLVITILVAANYNLGTFYHEMFAKLQNVAVKEKGYAKLQVIIELYLTRS
jgi:hypothetical protein